MEKLSRGSIPRNNPPVTEQELTRGAMRVFAGHEAVYSCALCPEEVLQTGWPEGWRFLRDGRAACGRHKRKEGRWS